MNGEKLDLTLVSASSEYSASYPATNAFDGSTDSYWRTVNYPEYPQSIVVELNDFYSLCGFRFYPGTTYEAYSFKIFASLDGLDFTEVYSSACQSASSFIDFEFSSTLPSKHVKIEFTDGTANRLYVREFELYGTLAEPEEPSVPEEEPSASLPSGYKKLKYIQSSGTQYINTEFIPNGNTRVVCDFQMMAAFSASAGVFGARTSGTSQIYALFHIRANTFRTDYYGYTPEFAVANDQARMTVDKNKNVTVLDGVTTTSAASTVSTGYPLYLFAVNYTGELRYPATARIFSCQIYDNGTLVRDFVPVKNSVGTVGLYDVVNSVFYANAGTGAFTAGPLATGPVDGMGATIKAATSYGISNGKTLVGGTVYIIEKGKIFIDGTAYDVICDDGMIPVTITGAGDAYSCYARINGIEYSSAISGIEVMSGDVIRLYALSASDAYKSQIIINGTTVASSGASGLQASYDWTVPEECESITIQLAKKTNVSTQMYYHITVTTT